MLWASVPVFDHLQGNSIFLLLSWITLPNHPPCLLSLHGTSLRRLHVLPCAFPQIAENSKISLLFSRLSKPTNPSPKHHVLHPKHLGNLLGQSLKSQNTFLCCGLPALVQPGSTQEEEEQEGRGCKVSQNLHGRMLEEGRVCWLPEDGDAELASSLTTSRRACQSEREWRRQ